MILRTAAFLVAVLVSVVGLAQPVATPDASELSGLIEKSRTDWNVPGLSVAVVKDGQVILAQGFGVRELGKPETVDADTLFAIASNTKEIGRAHV